MIEHSSRYEHLSLEYKLLVDEETKKIYRDNMEKVRRREIGSEYFLFSLSELYRMSEREAIEILRWKELNDKRNRK